LSPPISKIADRRGSNAYNVRSARPPCCEYWLNLQADFDLKFAERDLDKRLNAVVELVPG